MLSSVLIGDAQLVTVNAEDDSSIRLGAVVAMSCDHTRWMDVSTANTTKPNLQGQTFGIVFQINSCTWQHELHGR
jgi:hypothetical protein